VASLVLGAAFVVLALIVVLQIEAPPPPVVRGSPAPPFALERLGAPKESSEGSLSLGELSGKVVLLNFWATWCEPCEREMPAMERLYASLPRSGFELVAVAIDEDAIPVERFQENYALSFPILLDPSQEIYRDYQTMGVPESLLIDASGRVVERYVGPRAWDAPEYVERIRALMQD
jgi:thiol-disulfide isomerase/thioredoxin